MNFFRKKNSPALGVDLNSLSVSFLELAVHENNWSVNGFKRQFLMNKNIDSLSQNSAEAVDIQSVSQAISAIYQAGKFKSKQAVTALSNTHMIMKELKVASSLKNSDLTEYVLLEAEKHIPYAIESIAWDFEKIKNKPQSVELVACRKQCVDDLENILVLSGLKPWAIEGVTHALERTYPLLKNQLNIIEDSVAIAVFHIDDISSIFSIIQDSHTLYSQSVNFGIQQLAEMINSDQSHPIQDIMQSCIELNNTLITDTNSQSILNEIKRQIKLSLEQFKAIHYDQNIHSVIISGSFPKQLVNLEQLSQNIEIPCVFANPFQNMQVCESVDRQALDVASSSLLLACGLAMRKQL